MQAELEKWVEDNSELGVNLKSWVIPEKAVRALLAGKVLCDSIAVDCHECSGNGYHWGSVNRANKRFGCVTCNETGKLYAPAGMGKEGGE